MNIREEVKKLVEALEGKQLAGCFCQRQGLCFDFTTKAPKIKDPVEDLAYECGTTMLLAAKQTWSDLLPIPSFFSFISSVKCIRAFSTSCISWSWIWGKHQACPLCGDAVVHLKMNYVYRSKDYYKKYVFLLGKCGLNCRICFMGGRRKRCWGCRVLHSRAYQSVLGTIKRPEIELGLLPIVD